MNRDEKNMSYETVAVRTSNTFTQSESDIEQVKLSDGSVETKAQVVKYIDQDMEYYFTASNGSHAVVETVHPAYSDPYIRTVANRTTRDNLLSLPRF